MRFFICVLTTILGALYPSSIARRDFLVTLDSMDNYEKVSREFIDWHFQLKRINKLEKVPTGYFHFKAEIREPTFFFQAFVKSNGKFLKLGVNELRPRSGCDEFIKNLILEFFVGNSSIQRTDEGCIITPGVMVLPDDGTFNITEFARGRVKNLLYGTYKIEVKIKNIDDIVIFMFNWIMSVIKKV